LLCPEPPTASPAGGRGVLGGEQAAARRRVFVFVFRRRRQQARQRRRRRRQQARRQPQQQLQKGDDAGDLVDDDDVVSAQRARAAPRRPPPRAPRQRDRGQAAARQRAHGDEPAAQQGAREPRAGHADVEGARAALVEAAVRVKVRGEDVDGVAAGRELGGGVDDQALGAAEAKVRVQKGDAEELGVGGAASRGRGGHAFGLGSFGGSRA